MKKELPIRIICKEEISINDKELIGRNCEVFLPDGIEKFDVVSIEFV